MPARRLSKDTGPFRHRGKINVAETRRMCCSLMMCVDRQATNSRQGGWSGAGVVEVTVRGRGARASPATLFLCIYAGCVIPGSSQPHYLPIR